MNEISKLECTRHAHNSDSQLCTTAFRKMEKRFKELRPDPRRKVRPRQENSLQGEKEPYSNPHPRCNDFSDVLDMRTAHHKRLNQEPLPPSFQFIGTTVTKRSIYTVTERPGLYVIPYAVELQQQADFLSRALTEYPQDPHYNNNLVNLGNSPLSGYQPELRWITLGYGYDWTRKAYPLSDSGPRPHVPHEVVQIARALHDDLNSIVPQPRPSTYEPQTAIVNYFPVHSTMMAHQDVSEHCLDRALISISFGCSAIFLMGTDDRNVEPTPLFLRSGDVLIMTGATRTGYHGVPRILDDFPSELYEEVVKQVPIEKDLLQKLRVNINIRQVHEATHDS